MRGRLDNVLAPVLTGQETPKAALQEAQTQLTDVIAQQRALSK